MNQKIYVVGLHLRAAERWPLVAAAHGAQLVGVGSVAEAVRDIAVRPLDYGVVIDRHVAPIQDAPDAAPTLPIIDAAVARFGRNGWLNVYDYCPNNMGLRLYPRGYPYDCRNRIDNADAQIPRSADAAPPLDIFSFIVGGTAPEMNAADALVLRAAHLSSPQFPEDPRIQGMRVGRWNYAPLSTRAFCITPAAASLWSGAREKFAGTHPAFASLIAHYAVTAVAHASDRAVAIGGRVLPGCEPNADVFARARAEAPELQSMEALRAVLDTWRPSAGQKDADALESLLQRFRAVLTASPV